MLRRLLDSPWTYFAGAGILLLVLVATQFEIRLPTRPEAGVDEIAKLRERGGLG